MNSLFLILFSFLFFCNLQSENKEELEEQKHVINLVQTFEVFELEKANQIWPAFTLSDSPSIIHFSNGHIYSFYMASNQKWKSKTINQYSVLFSEQDHWGVTKIMMHPNFSVDGKPTFVFRFDNGKKQEKDNLSLLTFVHERFHLHQFAHFVPQERRSAQYEDEWMEDNHILAELEHQLLKDFILSSNESEKMEYLKDFIAINKTRLSRLNPSSIDWEDNQQRMEGLADYVSLQTFEIFPELNPISIPDVLLEMRDKKTGVVYSLINDIIKSRHYFVGAILGFALDFCGVDWKKEVEKGASLREILHREVNISSNEVEERFLKLSHSKDFESMKNRVSEKLKKEKDEKDEMLEGFYQSSGVPVYLGRPKQSISGGGNNRKNCNLGQGHLLAQYDTSFSSTKDQKWKLRFKQIPFIFEDPLGSRIFKIEKETVLKIDDNSISVQDLQASDHSYHFKSIEWKSEHCEFEANYPGYLYSKEGKIYIKFAR